MRLFEVLEISAYRWPTKMLDLLAAQHNDSTRHHDNEWADVEPGASTAAFVAHPGHSLSATCLHLWVPSLSTLQEPPAARG